MTEEQKKIYLSKLSKHSETTNTIISYSIQRIDLLIISVSGAGIYACFEIIKYLYGEFGPIDYSGLKIAGLLFIAAIVINFISQWFGYYGNKYEKASTDRIIHSLENNIYGDEKVKAEVDALDYWVQFFNRLNRASNVMSTVAMFTGLILISIVTWRIL